MCLSQAVAAAEKANIPRTAERAAKPDLMVLSFMVNGRLTDFRCLTRDFTKS
jgi:hypothetical protein